MRAPRAEDWRSRRDVQPDRMAGEPCGNEARLAQSVPDHVARQLAVAREVSLPAHRDARSAKLIFHERLELFHDDHPIDGCGETPDQLEGQRVRESELQRAGLGEHLTDVLVGDAARDDPDRRAP